MGRLSAMAHVCTYVRTYVPTRSRQETTNQMSKTKKKIVCLSKI